MNLSRRPFLIGATASIACGVEPPPASRPAPRTEPRHLSLLTYNILADADRLDARFDALSRVIANADADIVALQEVSDLLLRRLGAQPWFARYNGSRPGGELGAPGGQFILAKAPIRRSWARPLVGPQRRTVVLSEVVTQPGPLWVATTHLESYLEDGPIRARQLAKCFAELAGGAHAILAGDLNFGDGEQPDSGALNPGYVDAWRATYPSAPGFTWNIEQSEMARVSSFPGEPSRRLDRILVRSARWRPTAARIVGDEPVVRGDHRLYPSDHFGLVAAFEA